MGEELTAGTPSHDGLVGKMRFLFQRGEKLRFQLLVFGGVSCGATTQVL